MVEAEDYEISVDALPSAWSAAEIELLSRFHTSDRLIDADLTRLADLGSDLQELSLLTGDPRCRPLRTLLER